MGTAHTFEAPRRIRRGDGEAIEAAIGTYLTDETMLYRIVGWLAREQLVAVEDCHSLEVLLVEPRHLDGLRIIDSTQPGRS